VCYWVFIAKWGCNRDKKGSNKLILLTAGNAVNNTVNIVELRLGYGRP